MELHWEGKPGGIPSEFVSDARSDRPFSRFPQRTPKVSKPNSALELASMVLRMDLLPHSTPPRLQSIGSLQTQVIACGRNSRASHVPLLIDMVAPFARFPSFLESPVFL